MSKYTAHYPVQLKGKIIEAGEVFEADQATVDMLNAKGAMCKAVAPAKAVSAPRPPRTKSKPAPKKAPVPPVAKE